MGNHELLEKLGHELEVGVKILKRLSIDTNRAQILQHRISSYVAVSFNFKDKLILFSDLIELTLFIEKQGKHLEINWLKTAFSLLKDDLNENMDKLTLYRYYHEIDLEWQQLHSSSQSYKEELGPREQNEFDRLSRIKDSLFDRVQLLAEEDFSVLLGHMVSKYSTEFYDYNRQSLREKHGGPAPIVPNHLPNWVKEVFEATVLHGSLSEFIISSTKYIQIILLASRTSLFDQIHVATNKEQSQRSPEVTVATEEQTFLYPQLSEVSQEISLYPQLTEQTTKSSFASVLQTIQPNYHERPSAPPMTVEDEIEICTQYSSAPALNDLSEQEQKKWQENLTDEEKQQWAKELLAQNGYKQSSTEDDAHAEQDNASTISSTSRLGQ